jgi:sporulation protein YlmC with PRC-barrel domain
MDLVRDILDAELLDKKGRHLGRIDGIVLELREGRPPRVAVMETGAATVAARVHPRLGRWFRAWPAVQIPMHAIRDIGVDVEIDVDGDRDPQLLRGEKWARRFITRIPGGGR